MIQRRSFILILILGLCGCGGGGGSGSSGTPTPSPAASPTATPTASPTPSPSAMPSPTPAPTTTPTPTPSPTPAPQQFTLAPAADATLYESTGGSLASGAGGALYAGRTAQTSNALRRLVIRFDLSGLPAGQPTSAELQMTVTKQRSGAPSATFTLHRLLESWNEGPSNAGDTRAGSGTAAQNGDTTWLHRNFDTQFWGTAGGVFAATASGTVTVTATGEVLIQSQDAGMEQDIADWRADPASNFGWLLMGGENQSSTAREWSSREHPAPDNRPELILSYP